VTVTVASVLPADADVSRPKGIGPPVLLPSLSLPAGIWALAGVLITLLTIGAIGWRRHRRARRPLNGVRAAHLVALDQLDRLQRAELVGLGRTTEFYIRLSNILRQYTLWRFGLKAPTQTTEELLANLADVGGTAGAYRDAIGGLMADCDLVKFARHQPSREAAHLALQRARDLVEWTGDPQVVVDDPLVARG
jgi:Domain of unknown function (DUF4381)